jgi:tetracycline 7-halogenase / FADH2 O2-dependent halogenase
VEIVNSLAWRLIEATRDGDWSTERFAYINAAQQGLFDVHDDLVFCSFVGFQHYELWNAVVRVWKTTSILPTMTIERALRKYLSNRDDQIFRDLENTPTPGLPALIGPDVSALLAFTRNTCLSVQAGELPPGEAAARIFARLDASDFLPEPFALGDPDNRFFEATPELLERVRRWGLTSAPQRIRPLFD